MSEISKSLLNTVAKELQISHCSLQMTNKTGNLLNYASNGEVAVSGDASYNRVPGIMRLAFAPCVGGGGDTDINTISTKRFASLIKKISGAKAIEKSDYMIYLLCGGSLYAAAARLKAVYGLPSQIGTYNAYFTDSIIRSMGFDPVDVQQNREDFRGYINAFIAKVNALNFPKLPLFDRWEAINNTIVMDSPDGPRAQAYVLDMDYYFKWNATVDNHGTVAEAVRLSDSKTSIKTVKEAMTFFNSLVDTMLRDEDCISISAWIENLGEPLRTIPLLTTEYKCDVLLGDTNLLSAIENATLVYHPDSYAATTRSVDGFSVLQNNGNIGQSWLHSITNKSEYAYFVAPLLNLHTSKVTPQQIATATQWTNYMYAGLVVSGNRQISLGNASTEVIYGMYVVTDPYNIASRWQHEFKHDCKSTSDEYTDYTDIVLVDFLCTFDYHPTIIYATYGAGTQSITNVNRYVDYDNYRELSRQDVENIHRAAWYTAFDLKMD